MNTSRSKSPASAKKTKETASQHSGRVGLREIADRTGLSVGTVSNILNGRTQAKWPSVKARSRKVWEVANELNYRPNASARTTRTGQFGSVALVTRATFQNIPFQLVVGLSQNLKSEGAGTLAFDIVPGGILHEHGADAPRIFREFFADGMFLFLAHGIDEGLHDAISQLAVPAIWINEKAGKNCVYPDEFSGAQKLTEALVHDGADHCGYLSFFSDPAKDQDDVPHFSNRDRYEGFLKAIHSAGVRHTARFIGVQVPTEFATKMEIARRVVTEKDAPRHWVCYEYEEAVCLYRAYSELGMQPNKDFRLACMTMRSSPHILIPILCARMDWEKIAAECVKAMIRRIADKTVEAPAVRVPMCIECHA